MKANKEQ